MKLSDHISREDTQSSTVLDKIITYKKQWVMDAQIRKPLKSFLNQLHQCDRDFYAALQQSHRCFILECKKASPSKGLLNKAFNLNEIAATYKKNADVISVLTDEKFFQGKFSDIQQVRKNVHQPILCKDFIIDDYQIYKARYSHADAVLLMLSVLSDKQYQRLSALAHQLNMGVLTEISNDVECDRACRLGAKVIGINNRNLKDLSTDLSVTQRLAPKIKEQSPNAIIISESGFSSHRQIMQTAPYVNGFLIGSSLMSATDLGLAVNAMVYGEHKICGLTRAEDALNAYTEGSFFGGLIFAKSSKRQINIDRAHQIINSAPLNYVAVFQNQSISNIIDTAKHLPLFAIQLHGNESQTYINALRQKLPKVMQIWKAYGISPSTTPSIPKPFHEGIDKHVLDTRSGQQHGGTGLTFDWSAIKSPEQFMLAGGLRLSNVAQANQLGCLGLDICSGVESSLGIKDKDLLSDLFTAIKTS